MIEVAAFGPLWGWGWFDWGHHDVTVDRARFATVSGESRVLLRQHLGSRSRASRRRRLSRSGGDRPVWRRPHLPRSVRPDISVDMWATLALRARDRRRRAPARRSGPHGGGEHFGGGGGGRSARAVHARRRPFRRRQWMLLVDLAAVVTAAADTAGAVVTAAAVVHRGWRSRRRRWSRRWASRSALTVGPLRAIARVQAPPGAAMVLRDASIPGTTWRMARQRVAGRFGPPYGAEIRRLIYVVSDDVMDDSR